MLRTMIACAMLAGIAAPAPAACFGNSAFSTCSNILPGEGRTALPVQRTDRDEREAPADSRWSETSRMLGATPFLERFAANGGGGIIVGRRIGNGKYFLGPDARGNSVARRCDRFACY